MKNLIIFTLALLAQIVCVFAQTNPATSQKKYLAQLKGTWVLYNWKDRDKNYSDSEGSLIFEDNNKISMIIRTDTLIGTFVYNIQKSPHWIDFNLKSNTGQIVQLQGIILWIDNETARMDMVPKGEVRPTTFESEPEYDNSAFMRKQVISFHYLKLHLVKDKWDILRLAEAVNYSPGNKYQTITFQENNRFILEGTVFIPGSSGEGRYELNTNKFPYWIDLYYDEGRKNWGLIKEHLSGFKLELFDPVLCDGHPKQFSDIELGLPDMINYNPNFYYLNSQLTDTKSAGESSIIEANKIVPIEQVNKPKENTDISSIKPVRVKASSIYPPDNSTYEPSFTIDNNTSTAWFPQRTNKLNSGQWLKFEFEQVTTIAEIGIINGWTKSDNLWSLNSRVKDVTINFSNGNVKTIRLEDIKSRQSISCNEIGVTWVMLTILDCYTGSTVEAGLTEVDFKGTAGKESIPVHIKREWDIVINYESGQLTGRLEIEKKDDDYTGKFWNNKTRKFDKVGNVGFWDSGLQFYHDGLVEFFRGEFNNGKINESYYRMGKNYSWSATEVFNPDNTIVYVARNANFTAKVSNPGQTINAEANAFGPQISTDGKTLYFYKQIPVDQKNYKQILYRSEFLNGLWTNPVPVIFWPNSNINTYYIKFSADGQTIYFNQRGVNDAFGGNSWDLFTSSYNGSTWSEPENMGILINSKFDEAQPTVSADNKMIVFSSKRQGSIGDNDLWMSMKDENGNWGQAVNLGIWVNTPTSEWRPYIAPDCKTLYFSSIVDNCYHVFRTTFNGFVWTEKEDLGPDINKSNYSQTSFTIDASGKTGYFASQKTESEDQKTYIYQVELPKPFCSEPVQVLSGVIKDQLNGSPVAADIWVEDIATGKMVYKSNSNAQTGRYKLVLPSGKNYSVSAQRDGFFFSSYRIDLPEGSVYKELTKEFSLAPVKKGVVVPINNIFFETGKAVLSNDSRVELSKALNLLKNNPGLKIEISGHTDSQGKMASNQTLSEQRAQAVKSYLINNGINASRLIAKGYGQTKPIADNTTPEGRQMNRRTEFMVMETGN